MKFLRTLLLSLIIVAIYAWTQSPVLNSYNLQLTGALILLYFGSKYFSRQSDNPFFFGTIVLISIVLLLIFSTGGINSPIFFVLYFLLFAIALLFAPYQAAVASLTLIVIFLSQNFKTFDSTMVIDLVSLALMTPLAVMFSKSYLKYLQSEGKISLLKESIRNEESESLLWISTTAKPSLSTVLNSLTDIIIYLNTKSQTMLIPKPLLTKLKIIQQDLITLYTSTGNLKRSIEESSDKMEL